MPTISPHVNGTVSEIPLLKVVVGPVLYLNVPI